MIQAGRVDGADGRVDAEAIFRTSPYAEFGLLGCASPAGSLFHAGSYAEKSIEAIRDQTKKPPCSGSL